MERPINKTISINSIFLSMTFISRYFSEYRPIGIPKLARCRQPFAAEVFIQN